ncbi:hypothetical protein, partial [Rhizomonospora bruguierae]|uniref:hypothetical protein n=1 Tax=Rhizomonospora bruguierae TaxID=1581705 RepID=UPI001BCAD299
GGTAGHGRRRREDERPLASGAGTEEDLFAVADEGVPAVTEPVAPYDGSADQAGPHLGGSGHRR